MDYSLGWFYGSVFLASFFGMFAGWLYRRSVDDIFWGLLGGLIAGLLIAFKGVAKYVYFDAFHPYQQGEQTVIEETVVIALKIPEMGTKQIHGLDMDEWDTLSEGVIHRQYRYTVRDLQDIFGNQSLGNSVYGRATQQLINAGVLVTSGANGVAVTDHVGKHFFEQIYKKDYKVLNMLPTPPDVEGV